MHITALDHIQIAMPAGEEDRARAFYSGVLGLEEVPKPPELAGRGGAWFARGPVQVHLGVDRDFKPARKAHPAFVVADLDAALVHLAERGVSSAPIEIVATLRRTYIHDPFGNRIELVDGRYNPEKSEKRRTAMGEPKTLYAVVINHEEQYTVIPKDQKPPRGYELTGFSGSPDQVLGYLKKVWTKATDEDFKKIISLLK